MKIKKILCFLLAAVLLVESGEGLACKKAEAAINYTGDYSKTKKTKSYGVICKEMFGVILKKQNAYKGKLHLSKANEYPGCQYEDRVVGDINVTIYKVGKNSYEGKKGKMKVKVKVYKNKIVIKQKGYSSDLYTDMSGTYKKK